MGGKDPLGVEGAIGVEQGGRAEALKRDFSLWSVFSLAFAFISPIVGMYAVFGIAFSIAGPAFWWSFPLVLAGQLLVACVFAELVSRWPLEGSVYQWSRRLMGDGFGWFAGWAYIWTLVITMAAVAYGAATFLAPLVGIEDPSNATLVLVALGVLGFATLANTLARAFLKAMVVLSITAELVASVVLGTVLLLFYRENSVWVLFDSFGTAGQGSYMAGPLLAAVAFVGYSFVGFETAGAVAEEVKDPERNAPKAIILSLLFVGGVVMYASLGLILAIPDLGAVVAGRVADPTTEALVAQLGSGITTPLFAMIVVGFVASLLAIQTSASRMIWAFARDRAIPASRFFSRLSGADRLPVNAILATAVVAAGFFLLAGSNVYTTIVSFATGGFYIAFALPVVAALVMRLRGRWQPGRFTLGRIGLLVNAAAATWLVFETFNIAWPRAADLPWYENWAVAIMFGVVGASGALCYLALRGRRPAGREVGSERTRPRTTGPEPAPDPIVGVSALAREPEKDGAAE